MNSAKEILSVYNGEEPFASFLKKYFAQHKKYGSTDRKQISHLCYCYFRLGKALQNQPVDEKVLIGLFLCSNASNEILQTIRPEWNEKIELHLREKLLIINYSLLITEVFPWKEELSSGINHEKFGESFFQQPDLFLRLRPGKKEIAIEKLQKANIRFKIISDSCLALDNSTKIDSIIELDDEAVIQDYNSQQTARFIESEIINQKPGIKAWDCCAGSGGKSIMLYDLVPINELVVSDIRESILMNLKKRFSKAGIKNYKSIVTDLFHDSPFTTHDFDLIIADVPCTGSGTWGRTPEQLFYFNESSIERFSQLQQKIVTNVLPRLQPGGYFLYITCSVFKKENEEVVNYIQKKFNVKLIKMPARITGSDGEVLKGYDKKADTMFVALLRKTL